jgi:hypothetical protein
VADHLGDLARAPHPQDDEQASEPKGQWCHALKHQGGAALVEIREEMTLPERRPAGRAQHAEVLGYLRQNVPCRGYPASIATGWHLGSGAVASAGQAVVAQRLELAGMRWRDKGTDAVCPLRARYRRERSQWQHFWRRNYQR